MTQVLKNLQMLVIKCVMSSLVRVCLVMQCAPNLMLDYSRNTWVSVPDSNYGKDGDVVASGSRVHLEMLDFFGTTIFPSSF